MIAKGYGAWKRFITVTVSEISDGTHQRVQCMPKWLFMASCIVFIQLFAVAQEGVAVKGTEELAQPTLRIHLEGETGNRINAILHNWLLPTPDANPGILEMMRLRDRKPPYEDPVPWAGEFIGKYLTSCVLIHRMTDDPALETLIKQVMAELISTQAPDGYMGPFPDKHLMDRWDLWGHYHCMLALYLWYRDTGDRTALDAALRAADLMCATFLDTGKRVHDAGSHEMNMAVIHVLGLLYRETGKELYFRLMKEIEKDWEKPPAGDYYRQALTGIPYYLTPKPRWESLHPMLGLSELYRITGDETYKQALLHWWHSIFTTDVHNSGSFSTNEQAVGNPFQPGSIETCCTVAWMALSLEALRLSSDSTIADALERATWNAVLGYEHPSGRWCTYDTPMSGKRLASAHAIVFQSRPGTPELNCCSVNGPRGLGFISDWAVLGDANGLYLNYYGPGTIEATLAEGVKWTFMQETRYPAEGSVRITVNPPSEVEMPLYVRIPGWSEETQVRINSTAISDPKPGAYLALKRSWKMGDVIELALDMRLWAIRGDKNVQFNTSLFRGPILLTYDQKFNTVEPDQIPEMDLDALQLTPASSEARFSPIVLFKANTIDGKDLFLVDFATAGAHGAAYTSWLPIKNAPSAPFHLKYPENNARLPLEDVFMMWNEAEPGSTYEARISKEPDLANPLVWEKNLDKAEFTCTTALEPGVKYYWQVIARKEGQEVKSANGPLEFTLDAGVPTSMKGTVLSAPLAGTAEPQEGKLLMADKVIPTANRNKEDKGALYFNGDNSKLVYEAPQFPLRTYTFSAWFQPQGLEADGKHWHHIFSAWCAPMNDALRVSLQDKHLVVNIEQPTGGYHLDGGKVENGRWIHVTVVKKFSELTLYVNGKKANSIAVPACLQPGPRNLGIGCNPNYGELEGFKGAIANVLFIREALTEEAIATLFNTK